MSNSLQFKWVMAEDADLVNGVAYATGSGPYLYTLYVRNTMNSDANITKLVTGLHEYIDLNTWDNMADKDCLFNSTVVYGNSWTFDNQTMESNDGSASSIPILF